MYLKHNLIVINLRSETLWLWLSWFECLSMKSERVGDVRVTSKIGNM